MSRVGHSKYNLERESVSEVRYSAYGALPLNTSRSLEDEPDLTPRAQVCQFAAVSSPLPSQLSAFSISWLGLAS